MMDFFLTYRQFLSSIKLCKLLILRFRWALLENTDDRSLVRIRYGRRMLCNVCLVINSFSIYSTFVVIRHWLTHYWDHDFSKSRTLRFILSTFLSELRSHPTILGSPRDARIIKSLRNLFKRQRKQKQEDMQSSDRTSLSTTPGLFDTRRSSNSGGMMIEEHRRKDSGFGNIQQHGRPNSTSSSSSTTISSSPWATRVSSSLKSIKRSMWYRASSSLTTATSDEIHYPSPQPSISTPIPSHTTTTTKSSRHQSHYSYPPNLTPSPSHRLLRTSPLGIERLSATIFGSDTNNSKSTYRPFILHYRTETVAQQFCMIERQMLQYVTWDELVELRWKDRRSGAASRSPIVDDGTKEQSGVEQLIGYFNRVSIKGCVYIDMAGKITRICIDMSMGDFRNRTISILGTPCACD